MGNNTADLLSQPLVPRGCQLPLKGEATPKTNITKLNDIGIDPLARCCIFSYFQFACELKIGKDAERKKAE